MKVLIVGDSFAANWQTKHPDLQGWPNLLANDHTVTNIAQAGASEYRILKQLQSVDVTLFDYIIVSHTSPYRIYTDYPVHTDSLHHNCDLLYNDVKNLAKYNLDFVAVETYFKKFFNTEYADFCYQATTNSILNCLGDSKCLHLKHQPHAVPYALDLSHLFVKYQGLINHYNDKGNQLVYNIVSKELTK